ncbi:hypothetical protein BH11MYX3_BH11MYX3_46280 [soil metagenome]
MTRALMFVAALAVAPVPAWAQEPAPPEVVPAKARALAEKGRAFHDAGDYGNAIIAFKEAYVMAPSPGLLFNLAQAYRLQGNCDDAAMMYRRYIATGPSIEGRTIAQGHLDTVERCAHNAALGIRQDSTSAGAMMINTDRRSGSLFSTAPPSHRSHVMKDVGLGLTIVGGIGVGLAAYFAYEAHNASAAVERGYAAGSKWKDLASIDAHGERSATYARVFAVSGGFAVAGGITMYILGKRTEQMAPISVAPTKNGAQVNVAWRF